MARSDATRKQEVETPNQLAASVVQALHQKQLDLLNLCHNFHARQCNFVHHQSVSIQKKQLFGHFCESLRWAFWNIFELFYLLKLFELWKLLKAFQYYDSFFYQNVVFFLFQVNVSTSTALLFWFWCCVKPWLFWEREVWARSFHSISTFTYTNLLDGALSCSDVGTQSCIWLTSVNCFFDIFCNFCWFLTKTFRFHCRLWSRHQRSKLHSCWILLHFPPETFRTYCWMGKSHRFPAHCNPHGYVCLFTSICPSRWKFRNLLLDSLDVHSFLVLGHHSRSKLLEMVYHSWHHFHHWTPHEIHLDEIEPWKVIRVIRNFVAVQGHSFGYQAAIPLLSSSGRLRFHQHTRYCTIWMASVYFE